MVNEKKKGLNDDLPVGAEADIVVVGSGSSGIAASIAAARKGHNVILIERYPFVGGMSTLIPIACWPLNTAVETGELDMPYDGLLCEIRDRLQSMNAIDLRILKEGVDKLIGIAGEGDKIATTKWYLYDPEALKYLYFEMLKEAGVKLRVNSLLVDTVVNNGRIEAIVVETLTRRELIKGKIFIDCTGSADVATRAGAESALGTGDNDGVPAGLMVPSSTTFRLAGVDTDNIDLDEVGRIYEECRLKGEINVPFEGFFPHIVCRGVIQLFGTRVFDINPLDPEKAALGEMEQRRQIRDIKDFLKRKFPAFRNCQLINTGVSIGLIGTRRIRGDYFITQQDIIEARKFEDAIAAGTYKLEIWETDGANAHFHHIIGTWYTIPFRSLLPKGLENVIVAGSCISGQIVAMATWAVMPMCYKTGQAAGTAAHLCIRDNVGPRGISIAELQHILRQDGVFLG